MIKIKEKNRTKERYFEGLGRRKTAVARVRVFPKERPGGGISVNGKGLADYFSVKKMQDTALSPLERLSLKGFSVTAKVQGGGLGSQAEAIRLGLSRALIVSDTALRPRLKAFGFLKRDPRMVERKKAGLRKARRPQQWRKR